MTGAERVAEVLAAFDIDRVWCFPGGTISPLLDAIAKQGIDIVVARNEAGAGHMAQAAYRISGKPQVVAVTSGPGCTNALTPLADAYFDGDAIVYLFGQVATTSMRLDRPVRQRGFQEVDSIALARPISVAQFAPRAPEDLVQNIEAALNICIQGRPGPAVVDCPMDLQRANCRPHIATTLHRGGPSFELSRLRAAMDVLLDLETVVICGRGVLGSTDQLRQLINLTRVPNAIDGWPVVCSMPAVGAIPSSWPEYKGMLGHTGHEEANAVIAMADALLVLGARLDIRQTGTEVAEWEKKTIIWVNRDLDELRHGRIKSVFTFWADCGEWLEQALTCLQ